MTRENTNHLASRSTSMLKLIWIIGALAGVVGLLLFALPSLRSTGPTPQPSSESPSDTWFVNIAPECGINFQHRSGTRRKKNMPEIMSGGVCWLDYDRDGYLDAYFVQGGNLLNATSETPGNQMFHNLRNGRFEEVTQTLQVGDQKFGMGCTVGDYNNDGWPDLYVTNAGANTLYENSGSSGTPGFREVTQRAGVGHPGFGSSAAFVDVDHDGLLDLFVVNYVRWSPDREVVCSGPTGESDFCTPIAYKAPAPDVLYKNNGDGTFSDITHDAGLSTIFGNGLGVVCADFNADGWIDIMVANDLQANQLWINQGNGTFQDQALVQGVAYSGNGVAESGMGIDAQDVDHDGDFDLLLTHFVGQTNTLYLFDRGFFNDQTMRMGLGTSRQFTGFGTAIMDFNNDGRLDIYVADGRVTLPKDSTILADPYADANQLFVGLTGGGFEEFMPRGGVDTQQHHSSRGAAFGDFDNDGDVDILVANRDGPAYVLENRASGDNHWIGFQVLNAFGGAAIGASVRIEWEGQLRLRDVRTAYSYCSANDPRVHFGLGEVEKIDRVTVRWVDGSTQTFGPFEANRYITLQQSP